MIDSSGSINDNANDIPGEGWHEVTRYIANVTNLLDIGYNLDRVSVITFSNSALLRFTFDAYTSKVELANTILNLPNAGGYTNTPMAFTIAKNNAFSPQSGDRSGINNKDIIVLLTDGEVTLGSAEQMVRDATELKNRGVHIIGMCVQVRGVA